MKLVVWVVVAVAAVIAWFFVFALFYALLFLVVAVYYGLILMRTAEEWERRWLLLFSAVLFCALLTLGYHYLI